MKYKKKSKQYQQKERFDKFNIPNGAKYFSSWIFQNYSAFTPAKK